MGGDICLTFEGTLATLHQKNPSNPNLPNRTGVYDVIFGPDKTQQDIFEGIGRDVLAAIFSGFNAAVLCHGNTGSGKTYTMFGTKSRRGLVPRILKSIFNNTKYNSMEVNVS